MSTKNHFVVWKGIRTGPFTKEELEREFTEGKIGLVRTVQIGGTMLPGNEFVTDIEIKRREDELEMQLQLQTQQMEASQKQAEEARQEADRQREEHQRQLEESAKRPAGKSNPPPIPDVNPWEPQSAGSTVQPPPPFAKNNTPPTGISWWDGKGPVIAASIFCLLCFLTGQGFRELSGLAVIGMGVTLIFRKRVAPGAILMACALLAYGLGFLLSDLIHDYITKNYPN